MLLRGLILPLFCLGLKVGSLVCEEVEIREVAVDKGANLTIPCGLDPANVVNKTVQWVHRGDRTHHKVLVDASLLLQRIDSADAGLYECSLENDIALLDRVNVTVRTEPHQLVNVSVHASTILAYLLWAVGGDGGHPIMHFTAEYRSATPVNGTLEPWKPISPNHISPNSRQIDVYHLLPNASYWFRVWASNVLGPGPPVEVAATTLYTDQQAELLKHFIYDAPRLEPRAWQAAGGVVLVALLLLAVGLGAAMCRDTRRDYTDDPDLMELVPNIIMNPGFMESDPYPKCTVVRSAECPGPGKPRKV